MAKKKRISTPRASSNGAASNGAGSAASIAAGTATASLANPAAAVVDALSHLGKPAQVPAAKLSTKPPVPAPAAAALPTEVVRGDWTVLILGLMMFFAPALGVPHEEMLQDTLKSAVVSFGALIAGLAFFWNQRNRREGLRWHGLMGLTLLLMVYALGSMIWSHTYLAGVEAIRWFVLSLLLWLGMNTISRDRLPTLAWGIHFGAVVASLWTALQFWVDFKYFPQGPNPASTFVNRNFFAEYVVCTLPFSVYLLARARQSSSIALLAFTLAFNLIALLMTGTRSALIALGFIAVILPVVLYIYRKQFAFSTWDSGQRILAIGLLLATVVGLGIIPTGNPRMVEDHATEKRGLTPLQRGFARTVSIAQKEEYTVKSFSVRLVMWKATGRIIEKRPLTGVGAGAWEADIPLYQAEGSQLETDYYVHNEILQLLAEYGLVGWVFLLLLLGYLSLAAWRTVRNRSAEGLAEVPLRGLTLLSLLAFLIISNAGFPWRLASTAAIFALCLAILAASDARLGYRSFGSVFRLNWQPAYSQALAIALMMCTALAAYITQQAAECESKIVKATKLALGISASQDPNNPKWDRAKAEMLRLIKEGTDINPHYRKITPMVADELAKWGDWKNATWIWESVISSRKHVVALMTNAARGYASTGEPEKALGHLAAAKKIQPTASAVRSLEVILLSRSGKEKEALDLARDAVEKKIYDFDLLNAAFILGWRAGDYPLALKSMEYRLQGWPESKAAGLVQLGNMQHTAIKDDAKALTSFKDALEITPEAQRANLLAQIPQVFHAKLQAKPAAAKPAPAASAAR
ncbi:MAG: O-antigen ligase family protein [Burkholderiaceae bacterium]